MGTIASIWGVGGILALLGMAVWQLSAPAVDTFAHTLQWYHWLFLMLSLPFFLYLKAYRGFQKSLAPRIAERAQQLQAHPTPLRLLFAPLYCFGFFAIERRKQIAAAGITVAMVVLILLVRRLPDPWRGIVDVGIVLALAWGFLTTLIFSVQALFGDSVFTAPATEQQG